MSFPPFDSPENHRPQKVPIPKLPRDDRPNQRHASHSEPKTRVRRACLLCRERKVKCSGVEPTCDNCQTGGKSCVYVGGRKDRLTAAKDQIQVYEDFLRKLKDQVSEEVCQQIDDLLLEANNDPGDGTPPSKRRKAPNTNETKSGTSALIATLDHSDGIGPCEETEPQHDENQQMDVTMPSPEFTWQSHPGRDDSYTREHVSTFDGSLSSSQDSAETIQQSTGLMESQQQEDLRQRPSALFGNPDHQDIELDYRVSLFEVPPREIAQRLVERYFETVHDTFPVIPKSQFLSHFDKCYASLGSGSTLLPPLQRRWLITLNLVLAIGARFTYLTAADYQADGRDVLLHYSRAHFLGLSLVGSPDPAQVQATTLLALFLLCVGRVNSAWVYVGMSVRSGHALSMHTQQEQLHAWWGICSLESMISMLVDWPGLESEDSHAIPSSSGQHDSSPLITATHETPNAGSYLRSRVQFALIAQRALAELYSPGKDERPWNEVQQSISGLTKKLQTAAEALPSELNFTLSDGNREISQKQWFLNFLYLGNMILIARPCLCRTDSRTDSRPIPDPWSSSQRVLGQTTAGTCTDLARTCTYLAEAFMNIYPPDLDVNFLYRSGLWWSILNAIKQIITVLVLELSFGVVHFPTSGKEILPFVKTLLRLLRRMRMKDPIADRIYVTAFGVLQRFAPQKGVDVSDLVTEEANLRANMDYAQSLASSYTQEGEGSTTFASTYQDIGTGDLSTSSHSKDWVTDLFGHPFDQKNPIVSGEAFL